MSFIISHTHKTTIIAPPRRCRSLELSFHYQSHESDILTLGEILADYNDNPEISLPELDFLPELHIKEKRCSIQQPSESTVRNNIPSYQIHIQGASIADIIDENKHKNVASSGTYSTQPMLGADITPKNAKGSIESEGTISPFLGSPLLTGIPLKSLKSEMLTIDNPETLRLAETERHGQDKFGSANSMSKKSYSENGKDRSERDPSEDVTQVGFSTQTTEAMSSMKKKWAKLSNVVNTIGLMKRQEVKMITHTSGIQIEIDEYNRLHHMKVDTSKERQISMSGEAAGDAFDLVRRIQVFCECAAIGSSDHIAHMIKMIEKDPKRFMLEPMDPLHILNKRNRFGMTPLYIAARNGNLLVTKLLIERKADHTLKSKVELEGDFEELPLQAAAKWGHSNIVEYLLKSNIYEKEIIKSCLKVGANATVRAYLKNHLSQNGKRSMFDTVCGCLSN